VHDIDGAVRRDQFIATETISAAVNYDERLIHTPKVQSRQPPWQTCQLRVSTQDGRRVAAEQDQIQFVAEDFDGQGFRMRGGHIGGHRCARVDQQTPACVGPQQRDVEVGGVAAAAAAPYPEMSGTVAVDGSSGRSYAPNRSPLPSCLQNICTPDPVMRTPSSVSVTSGGASADRFGADSPSFGTISAPAPARHRSRTAPSNGIDSSMVTGVPSSRPPTNRPSRTCNRVSDRLTARIPSASTCAGP
jgi:hypothetical protein